MSEWVMLNSSNLSRARWDEGTQVLELEFVGGRIYQYFDVPLTVYQGLLSAGSHGAFFAENIRGHFRFARS
jgi:hypothetical protein